MVITIVGWISCVLTINNLIFPTSWNFFLRFQEYLSFQNVIFYFEIKLNEYLKFYKSIYYLCTLLYQIIVLFFIFLDLFKTNLFIVKKLRKVFYFLFFIFSTFLTPPEVIYQLIISIFTIIIYELVIVYTVFKTELDNF
jgi:sec-independent protein translocase protein TatC